jgi:hypothetical protein
MKLKNLLISVAAVASLTACSNDNNMMEGAAIPTFTGTIAGQTATRMAGTAWDEGDSIGITASSGDNETSASNVKYVTANGDGAFSPAEGATTITFGSAQKATFSAYYPYTATSGTVSVSTAAANQTAEKQKSIDFLYASGATANIVRPEVKFQFNHVMSQLVLNIKAGTGVADLSKLTKIELGDLKLGGTFNTATGETSTTGDASSIELATTIASGTTSFEESLILLPQSVADSKLSLTLTYNNMEYSASLTLADGLVSGYSTTYNVTLNKTSISVSGGSINPWKSSTLSAEASEVPDPFVSAEDAELYALAFTDGTYLNIWDASNNKIDEGKWSKYKSSTDKTVCGIVYWLGNPAKDDGLLQTDYPDCSHGLILALKDMTDYDVAWQYDENLDYDLDYDNLKNEYTYKSVSDAIDGWTSELKPSSYESISIEYDDTKSSGDKVKLNKALGYNNTKLLYLYNSNYCVDGNEKYKVLPIDYLVSFAKDNAAPTGSCGWYLPSPKELVLLLGDNSDIIFYDGDEITSQFSNIQSILNTLSNASSMGYSWYWSSSECKHLYESGGNICTEYMAWYVRFDGGYNYGNVDYYYKYIDSFSRVRAVCAF